MYGYSCYGSVPYGGLLDHEDTTFPIALVLSKTEIYILSLSEA